MDSGSEITAKIRSAIKAKLVELGAYVDDELPDYIMVMIANKKTKQQMAEDLNLFLGKNSSVFTDWVHGVLERLQSISQKVASSKDKSSSDSTNKKSVASSTSTVGGGDEKRQEKHAEKRLSKHDVKENKPSSGGDRKSSSKKSSEKIKDYHHKSSDEKLTVASSAGGSKSSRDDDVLEMHPEIDGDDIDVEITGKSREQYSKVAGKSSSSQRKPIEAPTYSSSQRIGRVQPMKRRSPSPEERSSSARKRRSVVAQVVQREPDYYEEEYDPLRPQLGSVVRVSQRQYKVPTSMQPKPAIFLKALNEANASVSKRRTSTSPRRKRVSSTEYEHRSSRNSQSAVYAPSRDDDNEIADYSDREMDVDEEYKPEHPKIAQPIKLKRDSRKVEFSQQPPPPGVNVDAEEEELIVDTSETSVSMSSTRFVVTLDGVSSSFVKKVKEKQHNSANIDEKLMSPSTFVVSSTTSNVAVVVEESNQENDDQDTLIVGVDEDQLDDEQTNNQVNEVKICLDDDEEDDDVESPPTNSSAVATIGDATSEDGDKIMERCKFWPQCKLGSNCQFVHPTVPCKTFPGCRFGDRCMYVHPNCRYDSFCTNQHCPYSHTSQRRIAAIVQPPIIPKKTVINTALTPCKFGGRCLNQRCPYKHPKPCIYGLSCTRADCVFSHPILPPTPRPSSMMAASATGGEKFRWVAPPTTKTSPTVAVATTTTNLQTVSAVGAD